MLIPEAPNPNTYVGTDGLWEVRKRLFSQRRAHNAGATALSLIRMVNQLECVAMLKGGKDAYKGGRRFEIGIGDPETCDPRRTIYGSPAVKDFCAPLIEVIDELRITFPVATRRSTAIISPMGPGSEVDKHTDLFHQTEEKHVTGIWGESANVLDDPEFGLVRLSQGEGDTYVLRPDQEGISTGHGVRVVRGTRVALIMS